MFLHSKQAGSLVKIVDVNELIDPSKDAVKARVQEGQEEQDPEQFAKGDLVFPSGESLPLCWLDANYRSKNSAAS